MKGKLFLMILWEITPCVSRRKGGEFLGGRGCELL